MNKNNNNRKLNRRKFLKTTALATFVGTATGQSSIPLAFAKTQQSNNYWQKLRSNFPLTKDRIYFNNGTFGPSPIKVLEALKKSYNNINTTGNYGSTKNTFEAVAKFINADTDEISLTHNTTEGINIIANGLDLKNGDEVILTDQEHVGNALPWLNRAKNSGIVLKVFRPGNSAEENIEKISKLVSPKTKVIAIPHICCTTGLVFPIKEISEIARSKQIFTAIDGAHGLGSLSMDMKILDVDSYATCGHKWLLGPGGTGALYINKRVLNQIIPIHVGAYSDTSWKLDVDQQEMGPYNPAAHRFFYGTQGTALYHGIDAAVNFQKEIGKEKIENRIRTLNNYLYEGLKEYQNKIDILTPEEPASRFSMLTFRHKNIDYKEIGKKISAAGFRVRLVPESGTNGVRISTHIYNSEKEIQNFLIALENML
jgi:selenocysteine lyase/cysteine desulfurase